MQPALNFLVEDLGLGTFLQNSEAMDWAADPLTATVDDRVGDPLVPNPQPWISGLWQHHMLLAGSETSPIEPGYLAGAVEAAQRAAAGILLYTERSGR